MDIKYNSLRTYFVKQWRRVKDSERRSRYTGDVYRPSWPPYSKLLFLEAALVETPSNASSEGRNSNEEDSVTTGKKTRKKSSLSFHRGNSEEDLSLATMVANPRISDSFPADYDSVTTMPEMYRDVFSSPEMSGEVTSSPHAGNGESPKPKIWAKLSSSLHAGSAHSPIRIDDEIQEGVIENQNLQEDRLSKSPTDQPLLDSGRSHSPRPLSPRPHSPVLPRPIFPPTDLSSLPSVSTFPCGPNATSSLALSLTTDIPPPPKSRKRGHSNADDNLGIVIHDTMDSLRTVAESIRDDTNDDVSGFLRMIGFQLRSISDPLRRMRVMHSIQGVILEQITSNVT